MHVPRIFAMPYPLTRSFNREMSLPFSISGYYLFPSRSIKFLKNSNQLGILHNPRNSTAPSSAVSQEILLQQRSHCAPSHGLFISIPSPLVNSGVNFLETRVASVFFARVEKALAKVSSLP